MGSIPVQATKNYNTMNLDKLLEIRKQWYLDNEYKEFDELPPFIQLKLDTELRRDKEVIKWILKLQYDKK